MTYFLEKIASHLFDNFGNSLDRQCLVFPNRRAGLYFLKYLAGVAEKPVWAPSVKTINELFISLSGLQVAGPETLILELYRVYSRLNPKAESFDDFYFWGEMLLNDFDNVDKYLVNAESLFANLSDLKKIDTVFGELHEDQVKIIRQFWVNFNTGASTREKNDFLGLWSVLSELYTGFRNTLINKGIAYEGMIFREIADNFRKGISPDLNYENLHFVGFNALNNCEKILMNTLKRMNIAKFYWDYDESTVLNNPGHSAGFFIKENLRDFGNDMPDDWNYKTFVSKPAANVKRTIIDTSSDTAQVKMVSSLLTDIAEARGAEAHHTAVVLADESLLIPILSSIPDIIPDVNITMGYPLKFSPVYSLVSHLLLLQRNTRKTGEISLFDHNDVMNILRHSYFQGDKTQDSYKILAELVKENKQWIPDLLFKGRPVLERIFTSVSSPAALNDYLVKILQELYKTEDETGDESVGLSKEDKLRNEFISRTLMAMNRLEAAFAGSGISLTSTTWSRLLDKILKTITIPFSGEPLNGIQIMGILETRALDFRNLIILSVNEGILPRNSAGSSYIPYNLREAFGLPVIRHQDSIYAYYFYRLLQRAENVTFIYNSNTEGLKTGEMSRFLLQLNYLSDTPPEYKSPGFEIISAGTVPPSVERTQRHSEILENLFLVKGNKVLSPSAVNTWLNCRMRFYYRYICGIKEPDKIITEMDPALFGKRLHSVMEKIYSPVKGRIMGLEEITRLRNDSTLIRKHVNEVIRDIFRPGEEEERGGNEEITANILFSYSRLILKLDSSFAPVIITHLEEFVSSPVIIRYGVREADLIIGGYADRIDVTGGTRRLIDYKTGNVTMEIKSIESLFDEHDEKRSDAWFQILMYCEMLYSDPGRQKIRPSLYAVRNMAREKFSDKLIVASDRDNKIVIDDYSVIRDEYWAGLKQTLENIFNKDFPFIMTEHLRKCGYCPFLKLCRR
jgi:hypothetical protein